MNDYKEILEKRAKELQEALEKYGRYVDTSVIEEIKILIENIKDKVMSGELDSLNEDMRNKTIMTYHDRIDKAMEVLDRHKNKQEEKGEPCI